MGGRKIKETRRERTWAGHEDKHGFSSTNWHDHKQCIFIWRHSPYSRTAAKSRSDYSTNFKQSCAPAGRLNRTVVGRRDASERAQRPNRPIVTVTSGTMACAYASSSSVSVKLMETDVCPTHSRATAGAAVPSARTTKLSCVCMYESTD